MLRDDLISSSLSIGPGAGSISRIDASTWRLHCCAPSVHQWAQESSTTLHFFSGQLARFRDAHVESSNMSLFCDRTDSISNSQNTLFRQLCFCCGVRTHAELVDVVHHTLEGPTRIWCLRCLALCEIWPASLKVPRHLLLQQSLVFFFYEPTKSYPKSNCRRFEHEVSQAHNNCG